MAIVFPLIFLVMEIVVVLLHMLGLYLLKNLERKDMATPQLIYIMNLSFVEIIINFFYLAVNILFVMRSFSPTLIDYAKVYKYIELSGANTGLILIYYLTMFYILIDKVLEVFLNIKYPITWTLSRAKYLVLGTGLSGIVMAIGFVLAYYFNEKLEYQKPLKYFYLSFNFLFIAVAAASYSYIFFKFRQSHMRPTYEMNSTPKESLWKTFRNSRFYLSTLLILSFVVLVLIPDLILFFNPASFLFAARISPILFHISYMSDAAIYIFMYPPVKNLLIKKIRKKKTCFTSRDVV